MGQQGSGNRYVLEQQQQQQQQQQSKGMVDVSAGEEYDTFGAASEDPSTRVPNSHLDASDFDSLSEAPSSTAYHVGRIVEEMEEAIKRGAPVTDLQWSQRIGNIQDARLYLVEKRGRADVAERIFGAFRSEVLLGLEEVGPHALQQVGWMSRASSTALPTVRKNAWVFLRDYCRDINSDVDPHMRLAAYREVGNTLRVEKVKLTSARTVVLEENTKHEKRFLSCHAAQAADFDTHKFEFLPVRVSLQSTSTTLEFESWVTRVEHSNKGVFSCEVRKELSKVQSMESEGPLEGAVTQLVDPMRMEEATDCLQAAYEWIKQMRFPDEDSLKCIQSIWKEVLHSTIQTELLKQKGAKAAEGIFDRLVGAGAAAFGKELSPALLEAVREGRGLDFTNTDS